MQGDKVVEEDALIRWPCVVEILILTLWHSSDSIMLWESFYFPPRTDKLGIKLWKLKRTQKEWLINVPHDGGARLTTRATGENCSSQSTFMCFRGPVEVQT